jgi:Cof subfamily protein (haloacid dehalogenase superfamily)
VSAAYRLVATDLDGTLLRSDGTVSDRTRAALAGVEEAGAALVFVTGRPPRWMRPIAAATGRRGVAICCNGAVLYDLHDETVLHEQPLQPQALRDVVAALRAEIAEVAFAVEYGTGFAREAGYRTRWNAGQGDTVVADLDELARQPAVKLLMRHPTYGADELLARAREVLGDAATCVHSSTEGLLEISAPGVTKASALATFAAERGVPPESVVAFGDMPNDLPLLAWAGHAVAVANAHPDVLAAAHEVTGPNDEDGVAVVLERLFR